MSRRVLFVVAATFLAYIATVMQRSSLGVAAVEATERFEVAATMLSTLAAVQLVVYAALQVPFGALIDRIGPKAPLVAGAALMAVGQTTIALSEDVGVAVLGRVLVGIGDAGTFGAGVRLLVNWIPASRVPFVSQIFGVVGQSGQLLSAIPFVLLLHAAGWTPAFLSAAGLSVIVVVALLGALLTGGSPPYPDTAPRPTARETLRHLVDALRRPGTQIGFWAHAMTQSSQSIFVYLWGFPFLTVALGLPPATATALYSLTVVTAFVAGPLLGILSARFPMRRSNLVLAIVAAISIAWGVVLAWPGMPPIWLIVVLIVVISIGGPGSMIGFDYARTYNPMRQLGSANGIVNSGGFIATFAGMMLIGVVLDALDDGSGSLQSLYSLDSFRIAFLVQYLIIGVCVVMLLVTRRRIRRRMREEEGIVVGPLWLAIVRRIRSRRRGTGPDGPDPQAGVR